MSAAIDPVDSAANRFDNRAAFLGAAIKHLGAARRADAEALSDLMVAAIDQIAAAATVTLVLAGDDFPGRAQVVVQLGEKAEKHAEQIARSAIRAMVSVFLATLLAAERARADAPIGG